MNKMNMISLSELSEASVANGGKVILEGYYVINGDANKLNNIAHREFNYTPPVSGLPVFAGTNFVLSGPHHFGPMLFRWPGADVQQALPSDQGAAYVGSRVTHDNVTGLYTYEYNVYNMDMDTGLWSVAVPITPSTNPTGISFRQPRQYAPAYPSTNPLSVGGFIRAWDFTPWANTVGASALTYAPVAATAPNTDNNAIRWGTMYTYWFTSEQPPRSNAVITVARSADGSITPMTATVSGPRNFADITDIGSNGGPDGQLTVDDVITFFNTYSDGTGCPGAAPCSVADITGVGGLPAGPDGQLTVDDVILFSNSFSDG
jgi:hypothetical protein